MLEWLLWLLYCFICCCPLNYITCGIPATVISSILSAGIPIAIHQALSFLFDAAREFVLGI